MPLRGSRTLWTLILGVCIGIGGCWAAGKILDRSRPIQRIFLARPQPRYEPPPKIAVTLPDSPRVERTSPGPPVCVESLVPFKKEIKERFAVKEDEPILALKDFSRYPWGGDLAVTERGGRAEVTMRAFRAPVLDLAWRHDVVFDERLFFADQETMSYRAFSYEPLELTVKRRLRLYPHVGHMEINDLDGMYAGLAGKLSLGRP